MGVKRILLSLSFLSFSLAGLFLWYAKYGLSIVMLFVGTLLSFVLHLEQRALEAREVVLLSSLAAIAALGRLPFAALPSIQATSFVVIMTGVTFGSTAGFLVGAVAACASNIFLGQGLWTPFQMVAWGMMGVGAGWLGRHDRLTLRTPLSIYGAVTGLLFGWWMNLSVLLPFLDTLSWEVIAFTYVQSIWFDAAHAVSNVIFLTMLSPAWLRLLKRYRDVYGLLNAKPKHDL
ncbi:ECF transporter S component [Bacillaceae bacterium SIJ1]|uniref:ECF transporter S component n=1 Tax=Litoribacterium kuwaitense TaxID=1398745 RepID=UPI0013EA2439|nr:ECF transporter S component [Litoribacterium kuwaitense]NGP44470.1 ECF transporter S component [Litoribacterium kuwaitense]